MTDSDHEPSDDAAAVTTAPVDADGDLDVSDPVVDVAVIAADGTEADDAGGDGDED